MLMLVFFEEAAEEQQLCLASSQMYGKDLLSNLTYSVGPETTRAVFCTSFAGASEHQNNQRIGALRKQTGQHARDTSGLY